MFFFWFQYNPWVRSLNDCGFTVTVRQRFPTSIRKPPNKSEMPRAVKLILEFVGEEFPDAYDATQTFWQTTVIPNTNYFLVALFFFSSELLILHCRIDIVPSV